MAQRKTKSAGPSDRSVTSSGSRRRVQAPKLPYQPPRPKRKPPGIGIVGCGGIIGSHLRAYRRAGYPVVALADIDRSRAEKVRRQFCPQAVICGTAEELFARADVGIADLATHPRPRADLIDQALQANKHVLSQKPFVTDLEIGKRLVRKARRRNLVLAVNQNGRWAPHVSYARHAVAAGLLGDIESVDLAVHWDHNWCAGTPFDRIRHLALFDFGIHWFDMIRCYLPHARPLSVLATATCSESQKTRPPLLAQAVVKFARAEASLVLRGNTTLGSSDRTVIVGSKGTLISEGRDLNQQRVTIYLPGRVARPRLQTRWFDDGFDGTMSELMCAIESGNRPAHDAGDNLKTLALCFAAVRSADQGRVVKVGSATRVAD